MTATILTKSSDTATSVPSIQDLTKNSGGAELAVNTADQKLYVKNSSNAVVEVAPALNAYPVGSIYMSVTAATANDVSTILGGGTWLALGAGRVLVGHSSTDSAFDASSGTTGGNSTFSLTADNLPEHKHNTNIRFEGGEAAVLDTTLDYIDTGNSGEELDHNSSGNPGNTTRTQSNLKADDSTNQTSDTTTIDLLQPYLSVYMYKRTA